MAPRRCQKTTDMDLTSPVCACVFELMDVYHWGNRIPEGWSAQTCGKCMIYVLSLRAMNGHDDFFQHIQSIQFV
jgi:hypothetical protein